MSTFADVNVGPAPQTDDALRKAAASQVNLEIGQSTAPIQSQIDIAKGDEQKALTQVGGMFDALQPVVQQGAEATQAAYNQAQQQETSIFAAAQANLQKERASRAGDAQAMAQNIGGPVAMNDWTSPYTDAASDLTMLGAGQQLHTLAYAQAGEQEANQFSGQVMPLVRTEQMASVRNQYQDQIKQYQDQITALKAQTGAQVNKRYQELRTQELQYGLNRATLQLQRINDQKTYQLQAQKQKADIAQADRTYKLDTQSYNLQKQKNADDLKVALQTAHNDTRRVDLAYKEYGLSQKNWALDYARVYGTDPTGALKTLTAIQRDDQVSQWADQLGLSKQELKAKIKDQALQTQIEQKKLDATQNTQWVDLFDMAVNPQPGKSYTVTQQVAVPAAQAVAAIARGDTSIQVATDKKGKTIYYKNEQVTNTVANNMHPITNPNLLVSWLVDGMHDPQFGRDRAEKLILDRFPAFAKMGWHHFGDTWPPKDPKTKKPEDPSKPGESISDYLARIFPEGTKLEASMPGVTGDTAAMAAAKAAKPGTTWSASLDPTTGPPIYGQQKGHPVQKTTYGWIDPKTGKYIAYGG